jgi:hypothetical protein
MFFKTLATLASTSEISLAKSEKSGLGKKESVKGKMVSGILILLTKSEFYLRLASDYLHPRRYGND